VAENITLESLRKVPLFKDLDKKHLQRLAQLATRLDLPEGKELIREGEPGHEFVVVLKGEVEVRHDDKVIATRGPGDFVGEIALLADRPRTATVVTKTPVAVEVIGRREFLTMLDNEPEIAAQLEQAMKDRLAELDEG
jgi:CRP-like cAMP-binding protein